MQQIDAGLLLKHLTDQVWQTATARRCIGNLAWFGLRQFEEISHGVDTQCLIDHEQGRCGLQQAQGDKILAHVVAQFGVNILGNDVRSCCQQQRVTVRRCLGRLGNPDGARSARLVLDHKGLARLLAHFLGHRSG